MEDESSIIEQSKYYDDTDFKDALQQYNSKISILSLNCQSINAKYDKLKLFLDDVNTLKLNQYRSYVFKRAGVIMKLIN